MIRNRFALFVAGALAAASAVGWLAAARAAATTYTAYLGGLETGKATVPELVVFNTTAQPMSLTLVLRDTSGTTLGTAAEPLVVPGFNTAVLSLSAQLATAGPLGKPYLGRCSLEISGDAPFSDQTAVVHVTQYFGKPAKGALKPKSPKAAFIIRPLFVPPAGT
jgi:hypothetical protein